MEVQLPVKQEREDTLSAVRIGTELLDAKGEALPARGLPLQALACGEAGGLQTGTFRVSFAGDRAQKSVEMRIRMRNHRGDILAERRVPCAYTWPPDSIAITGFERLGINRIRVTGEYNFNSRARAQLLFLPIDPATKAPPPDEGILRLEAVEGGRSHPTVFDRGHGKFDWELCYKGWKTFTSSLLRAELADADSTAAIQAAGELIDGMLEKAEAAKIEHLGRWSSELSKSELDRRSAANDVISRVNGNIRVEYGLSRQKTPPLTRKVKVVLLEILIDENGDWSDGEIRVFTRVCDHPVPRPDPARPGEVIAPCAMQSISLGSVADGRLVPVNKTLFESDRLGPYLFIEVGTWDKDEPDWGDDNDLLGECSTTFMASENYGIGSTVLLTDGTHSGGPVTVRLLITDQ
ncbi:MAG: hypothetical protein HYX75_20580 [Acidobacteria bacterium]|nr:hypothetical protein [Acidobacteriota bacterium]